jgi:hypothetical protein
VCLEPYSVVGVKMLYKRWKTFQRVVNHAEVERTEPAGEYDEKKRLNFRWRLSEIASKSPYAAKEETYFVVNDKEKRRRDFRR